MATHTRTHVYVTFANPHLVCDQCAQPVSSWHDPQRCGCDEGGFRNQPCGHQSGVTNTRPAWSPVGGSPA